MEPVIFMEAVIFAKADLPHTGTVNLTGYIAGGAEDGSCSRRCDVQRQKSQARSVLLGCSGVKFVLYYCK